MSVEKVYKILWTCAHKLSIYSTGSKQTVKTARFSETTRTAHYIVWTRVVLRYAPQFQCQGRLIVVN